VAYFSSTNPPDRLAGFWVLRESLHLLQLMEEVLEQLAGVASAEA